MSPKNATKPLAAPNSMHASVAPCGVHLPKITAASAMNPWPEISQALKDIGYDGNVVMEPFVQMGGQIGSDIKVWRDLSGGAGEAGLDEAAREALAFLKPIFA